MTIAVEWVQGNQPMQVWHEQPDAQLPVRWRNGAMRMVAWGDSMQRSRSQENDNASGDLPKWPAGGWTRLDSILSGEWHAYEPREVKICAARFCVVDSTSVPHWVPLQPGQYLQGLVGTLRERQRVYLVTVPPPPYMMEINVNMWPRVIEAG